MRFEGEVAHRTGMHIAIAGSTGLVGRNVVTAAKAAGHDVIELALEMGDDFTSPNGLAERLAGADALVDVTASPTLDEAAATKFFTTVARNLGGAAKRAGVTRTVALSIIGCDRVPDYGYYKAKVAQERTTLENAPEPHILRAAQFLDFAGQMLRWNRNGDHVVVPEMEMQPVAVEEIARELVKIADGTDPRSHVEIAGPRKEKLSELVRQVVAHNGEQVTVEAKVDSPSMASGALLPDPDAIIAGPDFATWLSKQHA